MQQNNNTTTLLTLVQQENIQNNRSNSLVSPFGTIDHVDTQQWLSRFPLELNEPIPVVTAVRGITTRDYEGIENINQNQNIANEFIHSIQTNSNNLTINHETTELSDNFITSSQQMIDQNPNLSPQILSVFLNNSNLSELIVNLRQQLHILNQNSNYQEIIGPFMNSFLIFLSTQSNMDIVALRNFQTNMEEILLSLDTLSLNEQILNRTNEINTNSSINLDRFRTQIENLFNITQQQRSENFTQILNTNSIQIEEQNLRNLLNNVQLQEEIIQNSEKVEEESKIAIEKEKENTLNKIIKLSSNKKLQILIISAFSSLLAMKFGIPLPAIMRILSNPSSVPFSSNISSNDSSIRARDIYDLGLEKLFKFLKKF